MTPTELARRLSLIMVTDEPTADRSLIATVRAALRGGAPAIQLRAKHATAREMVELAQLLLQDTRAAGALLFVNDRLDVALAASADGGHLGQDDLPLAAARRLVPPGFLLGASVETPEQARQAEATGADYLGAGPIFVTDSKPDAGRPIGLDGLAQVVAAVGIPVVAIGGIDPANAVAVRGAGAVGIAVIRAITGAADPERQVRTLLRLMSAPPSG